MNGQKPSKGLAIAAVCGIICTLALAAWAVLKLYNSRKKDSKNAE